MNTVTRLANFAASNSHVKRSLEVIQEAIERYGADNLCLSFNGGKDCTIVLHLIHTTYQRLELGTEASKSNKCDKKLLAFYFKSDDSFNEEATFVEQVVKTYNLNLVQYSSPSLKQSLAQFKSEHPHTRAILIGTRTGDLYPGAQMSAFQLTDPGWPSFIRVNPILHWTYQQVWEFIRELQVPYCDLYNQGYSSFGVKSQSERNPSLLRRNSRGEPYYLGAWHLENHKDERTFRSSDPSP